MLQLHMSPPDPGPRHKGKKLLDGPAPCVLAIQPPWPKARRVTTAGTVANRRAKAGGQLTQTLGPQDGLAAGRHFKPTQPVQVPTVQAVDLFAR